MPARVTAVTRPLLFRARASLDAVEWRRIAVEGTLGLETSDAPEYRCPILCHVVDAATASTSKG